MNRKQFLLLVLAVILLGGVGAALFWQDIASYRESGAKIGARLLPGLKVSDVAQIRLQDGKSTATLVRKEKWWVVAERSDYPANFQDISDLLIKLVELKVVQSEAVGPSLLPRLNLAEPGKGEGAGTRVELKDAAGKSLYVLTLGKVVMKKDPGNPLPIAQDGVPAGRYVLVGSQDRVAVVSDPLNTAEARPGRWLDKQFFKVDRIKTLALNGEGGQQWKITRDLEYGQWKFASGGGELNASAAVGAVNSLSGLSFTDVVLDSPAEGADKSIIATAQTFDNLVYTLDLKKRKTGDEYLVQISVTGEPPKQRPPEPGEKPADKEKRDKEFEQVRQRLAGRVAIEQALSKWTYAVEAKQLAPLLKDRSELIAPKRPPEPPRGGMGLPPGMAFPPGMGR
jgi:hypothetical protein